MISSPSHEPTSRLVMRRLSSELKPCGTMSTPSATKCCLCSPTNGKIARSISLSRSTFNPNLMVFVYSFPKDGGISRTGKIIPGTEILGKGLEPGQYVDGEAFDPNLNFEELTSTFKTDPLKLKFHVFDFFDLAEALAAKMTFEQRWEYVKDSIYNPHYEYVEPTV